MHRSSLALGAALALATLCAFAPVVRNGFIGLDDATFITNNPQVRQGLTLEGVRWALTSLDHANWYPATWVVHMLNVQLFGLDAGRHHLTSLVLHVTAALLLFQALREMTGAVRASAFAAALFALHPLRVESVAWAAELKDVLSGCFFMLTLLAHTRYARRPTIARAGVTAAFLILGLMAKPMLVTLPLVLLLLDFWPLGRWIPRPALSAGRPPVAAPPFSRLLAEKIPLLAIAVTAALITLRAQARAGAVRSLITFPLMERMANALISLVAYLGKSLWPVNLAVIYPLSWTSQSPWRAAAAGTLLAAVTVAALRQARSRPALTVGWLWYLVTVAPVSGVVQVGAQAMADRYTYLPLIGVAIALTWWLSSLIRKLRLPAAPFAAAGAAALLALGSATWVQIGYWRDGATLFDHACDVTSDNWFAAYNAGVALDKAGRPEEAIARYRTALQIRPYFPDTWLMLGNSLARQGNLDAAADAYRRVLNGPHAAEAHSNLGMALLRSGRLAEAEEHFRAALRLNPDFPEARRGIAQALALQGR